MPLTRYLVALVAIALIGLVPIGTAGSAEAAKPPRVITVKGVEPKPQVFYLKGTIAPEYAKKKVVLERRVGASAPWRAFRTFKSTKTSRFKARIFRVASSQKTCWRVRVPKSGGYRSTKSDAKCVVRVG